MGAHDLLAVDPVLDAVEPLEHAGEADDERPDGVRRYRVRIGLQDQPDDVPIDPWFWKRFDCSWRYSHASVAFMIRVFAPSMVRPSGRTRAVPPP